MRKNLYLIFFLLIIPSAIGVTIEQGTIFNQSGTVYHQFDTQLTFDNISVTNNAILFDEYNLSLRPTTSTTNYNYFKSFTDITQNSFQYLGTNNNVNFTITKQGLPVALFYDNERVFDSFTAASSLKYYYLTQIFVLNMSFVDEDTQALITDLLYIDIIGTQNSYDYNTTTGYILLPDLATGEYTALISSGSYQNRTYYFTLDEETDTNVTVQMIREDESDRVLIRLFDTTGRYLPGADIKVLKYRVSSNSFELVETARTNFEGVAYVNLELNSAFYKFMVDIDGETVLTTESSYIYTTSLTLYVDLTSEEKNEYLDSFNVGGGISYNNITGVATFTFFDEQNTATKGCIQVYKIRYDSLILESNKCLSTSNGIITQTVENVTNTYHIKGYVHKNDKVYLVDEFITTPEQTYPSDTDGLFYMFLLMLIVAMIFIWDKTIMILTATMIPAIFSIAGLIPVGIHITLPLFFLGIVVAVILGVKR